MRYQLLFILIIPFLLVSGCKKTENKVVDILKSEDFINLQYGTHTSQTLDLYLPENRTSETRVIIFVHGGSWLNGDKSELTELATTFRDKGYATASVNYRLSRTTENNVYPAQLDDLENAVKFISNKSQEWEVSGELFSLLGVSAGGHLGMLYTYARNADNKIKTVISLAGPTDLLTLHNTSAQHAQVVQGFLGTNPQSNAAIYQQASPVGYVKSSSKPSLLFHGKLDVVVPYQQSLSLKARLDGVSVKNKLVTYENLSHEADLNLVPGFISECENWLDENFK